MCRAFGVREPDCFGIIDLGNGTATLLIPRLPIEVTPWMGRIEPPESYAERYAVDNVRYVDEMKELVRKTSSIHVLHGQNSDSGNWSDPAIGEDYFEGQPDTPKVDKTALFKIIADLRVFKTKAELAVLQHVSNVTSAAHVDVMRNILPGMGKSLAVWRFVCFHYHAQPGSASVR